MSKATVDAFRYRGLVAGQVLVGVDALGNMQPGEIVPTGHYEPFVDNSDPENPSLVYLGDGDVFMLWVEG